MPLKPLFFNNLFYNIAIDFIPFHRKIKKKKTPPSLDGGVTDIVISVNQICEICGLLFPLWTASNLRLGIC